MQVNMIQQEPLEPIQASPELGLFFERLLKIKQELKQAAEDTQDSRFQYFFDQLNLIITQGNHA